MLRRPGPTRSVFEQGRGDTVRDVDVVRRGRGGIGVGGRGRI